MFPQEPEALAETPHEVLITLRGPGLHLLATHSCKADWDSKQLALMGNEKESTENLIL